MFEAPTKYGIIVGVDGSVESDAAVSWAAREASTRSSAAHSAAWIAACEPSMPTMTGGRIRLSLILSSVLHHLDQGVGNHPRR